MNDCEVGTIHGTSQDLMKPFDVFEAKFDRVEQIGHVQSTHELFVCCVARVRHIGQSEGEIFCVDIDLGWGGCTGRIGGKAAPYLRLLCRLRWYGRR